MFPLNVSFIKSNLVLTLNLFIWKWRDWNEGKLFSQSFVKPVKMLVSSGNLDIVELKPKEAINDNIQGWILRVSPYTWGKLVRNEAL